MPDTLIYTHRQIIEEARAQAGLQARVGGAWGPPDQKFSDYTVAQRACDVMLEVWQETAIRQADALPLVTDRFSWPADTLAIALSGPPLGIGHPSFSEVPAFVRAIFDESGGADNAPEILLTDEQSVRSTYGGGGTSIRASRGYVLSAVVRSNRLELHPSPAPAFPMRVEYVGYPAAVRETSDAPYTSLPVDLMRGAVSRLAGDLVMIADDRAKSLPLIAVRQGKTTRAFKLRMDRAGPRFTNHLWSAYRAA